MSQENIELIKVWVATALVFAVGTLVMLYVILLLRRYGGDLPLIGSLPVASPPGMVPLLADPRLFVVLVAAHVSASGVALVLASQTIDLALLIAAKAMTVLIVALLGCWGGQTAYEQLTDGGAISTAGLLPMAIALAAFAALSTILSMASLRALGNLRFLVAVVAILAAPMILSAV
ncbi:MAG: hypothetical protein K0R85_2764 [Devosia sp.]|nr:hypothetical protein [Devosia sp.]